MGSRDGWPSLIDEIVREGARRMLAEAFQTASLAQLRWNLDRLGAHHGQPAFGDSSATGLIPRVIVRPTVSKTGDLVLDFAAIRADAARPRCCRRDGLARSNSAERTPPTAVPGSLSACL